MIPLLFLRSFIITVFYCLFVCSFVPLFCLVVFLFVCLLFFVVFLFCSQLVQSIGNE